MKSHRISSGWNARLLLSAAAVALLASSPAHGQRGGRGGSSDGKGPPRGGPLLDALDTDDDGSLSAEEIANAAAALLTLDTDGDGALSADELRPPRPSKR